MIKFLNGRSIQSEIFHKVETALKCELPSDFIEFILQNDGAIPEDNMIEYGSNGLTGLNELIPVEEMLHKISKIENFPDNLLPFGNASCGDILCIDIQNERVVLWDHETSDISIISKNFTSFINALQPFDESLLEDISSDFDHFNESPEFREKFKDYFY